MGYTDDPVSDYEAYDRALAKKEGRLPVCFDCGEPIWDDHCYQFSGIAICQECLRQNYWKETEELLRGSRRRKGVMTR